MQPDSKGCDHAFRTDESGLPADARHSLGAWFFAIGTVIALLGVVASANLFFATIAASVVIEVSILGAGIVMLSHAFRERRHPRGMAWLALAALYIGSSIWLMLNPGMAIRVLTLGLAALMFASGAVRLAISLVGQRRGWGWLAFSGLIGILAGLAVASGWPHDAIWVLGLLLAVDLLFHGIGLIAIGFAAQAERRMARSAFIKQTN